MASKYLVFLTAIFSVTVGQDMFNDDDSPLQNRTAVEATIERIFAFYDRDIKLYTIQNITLGMGIDARHVSVDESAGIVTLLATLQFTWKDLRLVFNASEMTLNQVVIDSSKVWKPFVDVFNSIDPVSIDSTDTHVNLMSDGTIVWSPRVTLRVPCHINFDRTFGGKSQCDFHFYLPYVMSGHMQFEPLQYNDSIKAEENVAYGVWRVSEVLAKKTPPQETFWHGLVFPAYMLWTIRIERLQIAKQIVEQTSAIALSIMIFSTVLLSEKQRIIILATVSITSSYLACISVQKTQKEIITSNSVILLTSIMVISTVCILMNGIFGKLSRCKRKVPAFLNFTKVFAIKIQHDNEEFNLSWSYVANVFDLFVLCVMSLSLFIMLCLLL